MDLVAEMGLRLRKAVKPPACHLPIALSDNLIAGTGAPAVARRGLR